MAIDNTNYGVGFRAPALPYPPEEYDRQQAEEFNNILRLYFNQLDTALRNATVSNRAEAVGWFLS
jgi:hypothetical protein|tara:strand:+ start:2016 stop:2210 length:195 start_codon:yes stop_codon:yes gene_type:complete